MKKIICPICGNEVRYPTKKRPNKNYIVRCGEPLHESCLWASAKGMPIPKRKTVPGIPERKTLNQNEVLVYVPEDGTRVVIETVRHTDGRDRSGYAYADYRAIERVDIEDEEQEEEHINSDRYRLEKKVVTHTLHLCALLIAWILFSINSTQFMFIPFILAVIILILWVGYANRI